MRVLYISRMFLLKLLLSAYFWSLIMCSVILKRRFECSVYELLWSGLNHGVGHEYVFQWGIAVKRWSAESVCRLSPALEGYPQ